MLITTDEIKAHLRIDLTPDSEEDAQIDAMYYAAVEYCENFIGTTMPEDSNGIKPMAKYAVLLVIGDLYDNREALSGPEEYSPNKTVERLLHFYREGLGV